MQGTVVANREFGLMDERDEGYLEGLWWGKEGLGMTSERMNGRSRGQRVRSKGEEMRGANGHGRSWELLSWRFLYCLSVCHGISQPNKEEFK